MSWMGKILGGGIGFMFGGPIGMVFGAVLGHHAMDSEGGGGGLLTTLETRQTVFFVATFSMLGKLAKADGIVNQQEIDAIDRVMRDNLRLSAQAREFAIKIFNEAKNTNQPFEAFAEQLYTAFRDAPQVLATQIDLLLVVALADSHLHQAEENLIKTAARIFQLEGQYEQIKSRHVSSGDDIGRCYQILGSSKGDALALIKKRYRKLAMEYHPDRVQSQGMSPELASAAEDRFKEIQHAYDTLENYLRKG